MPTNGTASTFQKTRAEIDIGALAHNYHYLKSRVTDGVKMIAVVKADAYGLGAAQVAPVLAQAGARSFFVAQLDEAIALRKILDRVLSKSILIS